MRISKLQMALMGLTLISHLSFSAPIAVQKNESPDILVGGLSVETGTFSGSVLNGSTVVHAENARSYNSGLCTFKINFLIYNDSPIKPGQFVTAMSYNEHPNVINSYTVLSNAGIKNYEWLVQLRPGRNTIVVHADQQNNIQEVNEANNILRRRVRVVGDCEAKTQFHSPAQSLSHESLKPSMQKQTSVPVKEINSASSSSAKKGCAYDPNDARLPCSRKPTMTLINPFE